MFINQLADYLTIYQLFQFDDDFNASSAEDINDILNTLGDIRQELIKEGIKGKGWFNG